MKVWRQHCGHLSVPTNTGFSKAYAILAGLVGKDITGFTSDETYKAPAEYL